MELALQPGGAPIEAQRSGFDGERRSSGMSEFSRFAGKGTIWSLLRRGGVMVSTGTRKQDKRVAAPSRLKMGNYKLKNDDNVVLAAA